MGKHRTSQNNRPDRPEPTPILKLWEKFDYLSRVKGDMIAGDPGAELAAKWQLCDDKLTDVFFEPIAREQSRLIVLAASTPSRTADDVRLKAQMLSQCLDKEPSEATTELVRSIVHDIIEQY